MGSLEDLTKIKDSKQAEVDGFLRLPRGSPSEARYKLSDFIPVPFVGMIKYSNRCAANFSYEESESRKSERQKVIERIVENRGMFLLIYGTTLAPWFTSYALYILFKSVYKINS